MKTSPADVCDAEFLEEIGRRVNREAFAVDLVSFSLVALFLVGAVGLACLVR